MKKSLYHVILLIFSGLVIKAQSNDNLKIEAGINGNIYCFGTFSGILTFSNIDSIGEFTEGPDLFISKMDSLGNILWINRLKGGNTAYTGYGAPGIGICTDKFDNVYVTAGFSNTLQLNATTSLTSNQFTSFIAKYNSNGILVWAKKPTISGFSAGFDLSIDDAGNIYAMGQYCNSSLTFDNLPSIPYQGSGPTITFDDIYVVKIDPTGSAAWLRGIHGGFHKYAMSIITSGSGSSYLSGYASGTGFLFSGSTGVSLSGDPFIIKYNSLGTDVWSKKATAGISDTYLEELALDKQGHIYGNGQFKMNIDFGPGTAAPLTTWTSANSKDLFVVKYDTSGTDIWAQQAATNTNVFSSGRGMGITIDSAGNNIFIAGQGQVDAKFNPLPTMTFSGDPAYIVKLNASGQGLCQVKVPHFKLIEDLTIDKKNNVYVIGTGWNAATEYIKIRKIKSDCSLSWIKNIKNNAFMPPVGIKSNVINNSLIVYPNPSNGKFTIETKSADKQFVFIFDLTGKLVFNEDFIGKAVIDVGHLNDGVYHLTIKTNNYLETKKMVIIKD